MFACAVCNVILREIRNATIYLSQVRELLAGWSRRPSVLRRAARQKSGLQAQG